MEETVKEILLRVCGPDALVPEIDLIESGVLDSLAFIELLAEFEDIGIEIQPTQVDRNKFRKVDGILELARQYQFFTFYAVA